MADITSLKPYFKDDIEQILKAILSASGLARDNSEYARGFKDCIRAVLLAVGYK